MRKGGKDLKAAKKKLAALALAGTLVAALGNGVSVSAENQGTDGTEMQVMEAEQLEVQLGKEWTGREFQLKTDAGLYPGTITVGEDGVLRTELGGSSRYILTCMITENPDDTEQALATENDVSKDTADAPDQEGEKKSRWRNRNWSAAAGTGRRQHRSGSRRGRHRKNSCRYSRQTSCHVFGWDGSGCRWPDCYPYHPETEGKSGGV